MRAYPISLATILAIAVVAAPARESAEAPEDAKTVAVLNAPEPRAEGARDPADAQTARACEPGENDVPSGGLEKVLSTLPEL